MRSVGREIVKKKTHDTTASSSAGVTSTIPMTTVPTTPVARPQRATTPRPVRPPTPEPFPQPLDMGTAEYIRVLKDKLLRAERACRFFEDQRRMVGEYHNADEERRIRFYSDQIQELQRDQERGANIYLELIKVREDTDKDLEEISEFLAESRRRGVQVPIAAVEDLVNTLKRRKREREATHVRGLDF